MNKTELVASYAAKQGISKKEAEIQVDAVFGTFIEGVEQDGIVEITKVIRVETVTTEARKGRNPQTGEEVDIAAGKKLKVKPLKRLKAIVGK